MSRYEEAKKIYSALGVDTEKALEAPNVVIRANTTRITADELVWKLAEEGVISEKTDIAKDALILSNTGSVEELDAYKEGLFHAQDLASQICCKALDPKPGEIIFDMCSAPGGKAFTIAETMENKGVVRAFDVYQSRVELIRSGAGRQGVDTHISEGLRVRHCTDAERVKDK